MPGLCKLHNLALLRDLYEPDSGTAILSIETYANSGPRIQPPQHKTPPAFRLPLSWPWIMALLLLLGLAISSRFVRQPARIALLVGLGVVGAWIACGGGGGGYTNNPPPLVATLTLSTRSVTFSGQKVLTTSSAQTVTVSNTGQATLFISGVLNDGVNATDFGLTNGCGRSLDVSASCNLSLTFTPQTIGARTTSIVVQNSSNEPPPGSPSVGPERLGTWASHQPR